jgi:hypothetical protein
MLIHNYAVASIKMIPPLSQKALPHLDAYPQYCGCNFQDATTTITESFCHLLKAYPGKNFKKEQKMSDKIMNVESPI